MTKLEFALMAVFWHRILNQFHRTSKYLQKVELDLNTANNMLQSLVTYVQALREDFENIECEAKELSSLVIQTYSDLDKRKRTQRLADSQRQIQNLEGTDKFRICTYYVIIDKLIAELKKRSSAYNEFIKLFGFLANLKNLGKNDLQRSAENLVGAYKKDLENTFVLELELFVAILKEQPPQLFSNRIHESLCEKGKGISLCPIKVLNWMVDKNITEIFPNVFIAYRLFVTAPIANCESERSFSVLKRIKNMYRSTMMQECVSSLAILSIESEIMRMLDFDSLIKDFATMKARKRSFVNKT